MRSMQTMDVVRRQLDRILFLRSTGQPWGPAVEGLRDVLVGLEDAEFWDGLPASARKQVKALEAEGDKAKLREARKIRERWAPNGWDEVPVAWEPVQVVVPVPGTGETRVEVRQRLKPTPENLSTMLRIMMALLHRHGLLWKTRRLSALPPVEAVEAGDA